MSQSPTTGADRVKGARGPARHGRRALDAPNLITLESGS
ncbi:hypothetical protein SCH4B_1521 [Ruegeria sp. TrichCH4B]|nr:hypothetical protein SCH4B_1521 [Ruegeria sp. TrichCH4B]